MGFLTKNKFVGAVFAISIITGIFFAFVTTDWCRTDAVCSLLYDDYYLLSGYLSLCILVIPLLPLSALIYFLPDRTFAAWKKFVLFSLPILAPLIFLVLMGIGYMGNAFVAGPNYTLHLLGIIYGLFFLISLIIITVSALRKN